MADMLSMGDLYDRFQKLGPGELILDVRTSEEFADGRVPGSLNISHEDVGGRVAELKKFSKIYVYCHMGGRARAAAHELEEAGLSGVGCVARGGMPEWEQAGYPVEK